MSLTGEELCCGEHAYEGFHISTGKANLLMIKAKEGFLGCGYFNIDVANKINDCVALVTGVKTYGDMLNAEVFAVSEAAKALGVDVGMTGQAALEKMMVSSEA